MLDFLKKKSLFCRCGQKEWEVAQTMYTHVSKYKNDKIEERKKKNKKGNPFKISNLVVFLL
jgi:hypothetical protein